MIIYIAGDNGSSAEGGLEGTLYENLYFNGIADHWQEELKAIDEIGGPKHFNHFPASWAHAMDTPFQWTKQVASHFGGTRNPMIVSWPARIKDKGGLRNQFLHIIDVVPTLYELIGITPPTELNGIEQKPLDGISFGFTFDDANAKSKRDAVLRDGLQPGNLSRRLDGVRPSFPPLAGKSRKFRPRQSEWELYNIDEDFSQAQRRRPSEPGKAAAAAGFMVGGGGEISTCFRSIGVASTV